MNIQPLNCSKVLKWVYIYISNISWQAQNIQIMQTWCIKVHHLNGVVYCKALCCELKLWWVILQMKWTVEPADHSANEIPLWLSGYGTGLVSRRLDGPETTPVFLNHGPYEAGIGMYTSHRYIWPKYPIICYYILFQRKDQEKPECHFVVSSESHGKMFITTYEFRLYIYWRSSMLIL